jgi:alkanesulfonate monooxygenase SsuD/methylene tetrahydromethanopterin reductase-like flavin-dependent oxidoreductase (luciferase family)
VCLCFPAIREASRGRYQDAPFGVPSPLNVEGGELKAQLARRREDDGVWLFEIRIGKFSQDADTRSAVVLAKAGTHTLRIRFAEGVSNVRL